MRTQLSVMIASVNSACLVLDWSNISTLFSLPLLSCYYIFARYSLLQTTYRVPSLMRCAISTIASRLNACLTSQQTSMKDVLGRTHYIASLFPYHYYNCFRDTPCNLCPYVVITQPQPYLELPGFVHIRFQSYIFKRSRSATSLLKYYSLQETYCCQMVMRILFSAGKASLLKTLRSGIGTPTVVKEKQPSLAPLKPPYTPRPHSLLSSLNESILYEAKSTARLFILVVQISIFESSVIVSFTLYLKTVSFPMRTSYLPLIGGSSPSQYSILSGREWNLRMLGMHSLDCILSIMSSFPRGPTSLLRMVVSARLNTFGRQQRTLSPAFTC